MNIQGIKALFLGDSITQGVGASDTDHIYCSLLAKKYGWDIRNYGISGTRIARQQIRRETIDSQDFCSRFAEMDENADLVVVFGGTNDYGHGDAPLGNMSDRTPDTFYGACHYLFSGLLTRYPRAEIVVMNPLHRAGDEKPAVHPYKEEKLPLITYVKALEEVAEYYALPVCDLYRSSKMTASVEVIRQTYLPDGLHPSDAGNALIASRLEKTLLAL